MRVLVIGLNYVPEPTGIAPYTAALCEGLVRRGHQVRLLTTMPHYPEWRVQDGYGGWTRDELIRGVRVHRMRHYVPSRPSGVRRLISEITFGLRAISTWWGRPSVVVFVSPALFSTAVAAVRARLSRIPTVVWVQDIYSLGIVETAGSRRGGIVGRLIRGLESNVIAGADGVCVIHDRFAAVVRRLGVQPDRVVVVRNWTHLPPLLDSSAAETRQRLGWGPHEVIALHAGAMGRKQDLENVVAAARLAETDGTSVRFVLMGNGSERPRLEASAMGLETTIQFLDPLPGDLYQRALSAADVLIVNEHAGLREMAVPSKLTSYFSSGRPVVAATDNESVTAFEIQASGAGVRVGAADPPGLLQAVLDVHANPELASEFGRRGQAYRDRVLSEESAITKFAAWLANISRSRPPGSARGQAARGL